MGTWRDKFADVRWGAGGQRLGGRIHNACADLAALPKCERACVPMVSIAMPSLLYALRGMFGAKVEPYDLHVAQASEYGFKGKHVSLLLIGLLVVKSPLSL